jgi:hypothetical protein
MTATLAGRHIEPSICYLPVDTHGKFAYQTSAISVFGLTLFQQERFIIQTMALDVAVYVHTLMDDEHVQLVS